MELPQKSINWKTILAGDSCRRRRGTPPQSRQKIKNVSKLDTFFRQRKGEIR